MTPPRPTNGPTHPTQEPIEVTVARLEERQREDHTDLTIVVGKVDALCRDVGPVIAWVATQMEAANASRRWRDGIVSDVIKSAMKQLLTIVGFLILTGTTMMVANPAEAARIFKSLTGAGG